MLRHSCAQPDSQCCTASSDSILPQGVAVLLGIVWLLNAWGMRFCYHLEARQRDSCGKKYSTPAPYKLQVCRLGESNRSIGGGHGAPGAIPQACELDVSLADRVHTIMVCFTVIAIVVYLASHGMGLDLTSINTNR